MTAKLQKAFKVPMLYLFTSPGCVCFHAQICNNASWQCWEEREKKKPVEGKFLFDLVGACFLPFLKVVVFMESSLLSLHHHIAANFHRFFFLASLIFAFCLSGGKSLFQAMNVLDTHLMVKTLAIKIKVFFLRVKNITQDERLMSAQTLSILSCSLKLPVSREALTRFLFPHSQHSHCDDFLCYHEASFVFHLLSREK